MEFPLYLQLVDETLKERGYVTRQYYMFIDRRTLINVRLDNVTSFGVAENLDEQTFIDMTVHYPGSTQEVFAGAMDAVTEKLKKYSSDLKY